MRLQPITWERLARELAGRVEELASSGGSTRRCVALDGAPVAGAAALAAAVAAELRLRGTPSLTVGTEGFLRPASLRLEWGHQDPDAYLNGWLDVPALWREVFAPLEPGGSGKVLPDLWDPGRDRATRSAPEHLPEGGVLLLHGPFLLGHWFPFDLTVHLHLSEGALRRRTPEQSQWTLPAFLRYDQESAPRETADLLVRADDPRRPAWSGEAAE